jgi:4-diphosphocytidyl-2-C-methyl-D-erythritol kinase
MRSLRIPAFAKVNLCLDILGRRADGYHELRTIFQTISLHDTLELSLTRQRGIQFECDDPSLPLGRENLVWRALDALRRALHLRSGIHAILYKRIPASRGLGGGSSDAAAALIGLLRLTRRTLPAARLLKIASGLGADVPFFLGGGRALGVGRGDEIFPLPDLPRRAVLVVSPAAISVPTRDAYAWVSSALSRAQARALTGRRQALKIQRFCALCWSSQWSALSNGFEKAVFARHPRLRHIKRKLLQGGAAEAALAGSGSAAFAIFPDPAQARRTARLFPDDRVFTVRTLSRREYLRALAWPGVS